MRWQSRGERKREGLKKKRYRKPLRQEKVEEVIEERRTWNTEGKGSLDKDERGTV